MFPIKHVLYARCVSADGITVLFSYYNSWNDQISTSSYSEADTVQYRISDLCRPAKRLITDKGDVVIPFGVPAESLYRRRTESVRYKDICYWSSLGTVRVDVPRNMRGEVVWSVEGHPTPNDGKKEDGCCCISLIHACGYHLWAHKSSQQWV